MAYTNLKRRSMSMESTNSKSIEDNWGSLYKIGGTSALIAVIVGLTEIFINFLPGGSISPATIID